MNRQQRRAMIRKRNTGTTNDNHISRQLEIRRGIEKAARDATVQVEADTATQRAMWLMVCSIADAYGFGPKRMQAFFGALQENTEELERMKAEDGEEYAYEKMRQKAESVTGSKIEYLYEKDWREALGKERVRGDEA